MKAEFLKLLRCPQTKTELVLEGESLINTDPYSRLSYPIRNRIPVLVPDQATPLPPTTWKEVMRRHGREDLAEESP